MRTICSCKVLPPLISARKENSNKKLKDTNNTLEQEIEALTHKIERMNTMQRQVRACDVMTSNYLSASIYRSLCWFVSVGCPQQRQQQQLGSELGFESK